MGIESEIEKIRKQHGGILRPEDVVESARPRSSPLHSRFDWDDTSAAHAWRLEQARHIIRVFVNVVGSFKDESRVYVALTSDKNSGGGYRVLTDVLRNSGMRDALLKDAFDDMERFRLKYEGLSELSRVFRAMKKIKSRAV